MNKTKVFRIALILLPLLLSVVVANPTGVTVIDGCQIITTSFLDPIEESIVGWCAPVSALLNYAIFAVVVIHCITKKQSWLKGVFGIAFAAMFLAALPILVEGNPKIIPNVLAAILFGVQCLLARILLKSAPQKEEKGGERLERR